MQLHRYRGLLLVGMVVCALLVASPAVEQLLVVPQTTFFTEFGILDAEREGLYPSNVSSGETNRLYLEVTNHMDSCSYYVIEVKFSTESQSVPDEFRRTNSDLPALSRLTLVVADEQTAELPLDVSFQYSPSGSGGSLNMESITLNGYAVDTSGTSIAWNAEREGFFGYLFFELWIQNGTTGSLQYHERFLGLWLKMKVSL